MEPKVERRISLASVNCPFCGTDKTLMASEEFENIGTGETEGVSIDYWDCSGCGYEIPILPEGMEREFKPLEKALGKGKEGLVSILKKDPYAYFPYEYSRYLANKKEFNKALTVLEALLEANPKDIQSQEMKAHVESFLACEAIRQRVQFYTLHIAEAIWGYPGVDSWLEEKTGKVLPVPVGKGKGFHGAEGYFSIKPIGTKRKLGLMRQFVGVIGPEDAKKELLATLEKRSTVGFEAALKRYPEVNDWWLGFRNRFLWDKASEWILGNLARG